MKRLVLGLTLLAVFGFAQSQITQGQKTNPKATQDQRGTKKQPLVIEGIPTKSEAEAREDREHRERQASIGVSVGDALKGIQKESERNTILTFWLFVVAVAQAILFAVQLTFMKKTVGDTKKAADAAATSAQTAREEFLSTHRPKIRIKHVWLYGKVEEGKPIRVNVLAVNVGGFDAHITQFGVVVHVVPNGKHHPNNPFYERNPVLLSERLPDGMTLDFLPQDAGALTLNEVGDIREGKSALHCFSYVDYFDTPEHVGRRKTSCHRMLLPVTIEALSEFSGVFIKTNYESEYEYQD